MSKHHQLNSFPREYVARLVKFHICTAVVDESEE